MARKTQNYRIIMAVGILILLIAALWVMKTNQNQTTDFTGEIKIEGEKFVRVLKDKVEHYEMISGFLADSRALFFGKGLNLPNESYTTLALLRRDKYVSSIFCIDVKMRGVGISPEGRMEKDFSGDKLLTETVKKGTGGRWEHGSSLFSRQTVHRLWIPVLKTETVALEGVAGLEIDIQALFEDLQKESIQYAGQYYMAVTPDMKVMLHSEKDKIGLGIDQGQVLAVNEDKVSGKASFFGGQPGFYRIFDVKNPDMKIISFVPETSVTQKNLRVYAKKGFYLLGVLLISLIAAHLVRLYGRNRTLLGENKVLQKERKELKDKEEEKNKIIATALNEIKAPLFTIISVASSMIEGAAIPTEAKSVLLSFVKTTKGLNHMLTNLIDYTGKNDLKPDLNFSPLRLHSLVEGVFSILSAPAMGKNLSMVNKVPKDFPEIFADYQQLEQALINIVGNAIKFSRHGVVEVTAEELENKILLRIQDNGLGVKSEKLELLNAALKSASLNIDPDLGLGLNISKRILRCHNGEIHVESDSNSGTCVVVTLQKGKK